MANNLMYPLVSVEGGPFCGFHWGCPDIDYQQKWLEAERDIAILEWDSLYRPAVGSTNPAIP